MRKTIIFYLLFVAIVPLKAQQYQIKGNITGFENGSKIYLRDLDEQRNIDSAEFYENSFGMTGFMNDCPRKLWLVIPVPGSWKSYSCFLFIGNEKVKITGDKKDFPFFLTVTGSKSQDIQNILNGSTKVLDQKRDSLTYIVSKLRLRWCSPYY